MQIHRNEIWDWFWRIYEFRKLAEANLFIMMRNKIHDFMLSFLALVAARLWNSSVTDPLLAVAALTEQHSVGMLLTEHNALPM